MKKHGVSLVEILVGASILVIAMVPIWGLMGSSHQQVMRSADEIKASELAIEILEQLENSGITSDLTVDNEELNSDATLTVGGESGVTVRIGHFEDYLRPRLYLSSSSVNDGFSGNREIGRVVELIIEYHSKEGRELSYTLRGFVSDKK